MEAVIRGITVYGFLLLVFRFAGKRTLSQTTTFDLVLLLIISETTQEAMVDSDHSVTNAFLLILTLIGCSVALSVLKQRFPRLDPALEDMPVIVIENGKLNHHAMDKTRTDETDILNAARMTQGLERLDQIKFAIVERSGDISIIPKQKE